MLIIKVCPDTVEIFDSLRSEEEEVKIFQIYGSRILFNETKVQGPESTKCGLFCIYVAFWRLTNLDLSFMEVMSDLFSNSFKRNDQLVDKFIEDNS